MNNFKVFFKNKQVYIKEYIGDIIKIHRWKDHPWTKGTKEIPKEIHFQARNIDVSNRKLKDNEFILPVGMVAEIINIEGDIITIKSGYDDYISKTSLKSLIKTTDFYLRNPSKFAFYSPKSWPKALKYAKSKIK